MKLNFFGDFLCGVLAILFALFNLVNINLNAIVTNRDNVLAANGLACFAYIFAELSAFKAISDGLMGPAISIASSNAVLVSILTWAINDISLSGLQMCGIVIGFVSVSVIANSSSTKQDNK